MRVRPLAVALLVMSLPACRGSDPAVLRMQMSLTEEGPTNASTDSKMMAPWSIDYELAAGLEEPASEARAWKALLPGDARTRLVALARALGVKGEVYEQGTDHVAVGSPSAGKGSTEAASASVTMWVGEAPGPGRTTRRRRHRRRVKSSSRVQPVRRTHRAVRARRLRPPRRRRSPSRRISRRRPRHCARRARSSARPDTTRTHSP